MKEAFNIAAAVFALIAAGFWFASARGTLPPMVAYWDAAPPNDPLYVAIRANFGGFESGGFPSVYG